MTSPAPPNAETLAALSKLVEAATPGPWCEHPNGTSVWTGEEYDSSGTKAQEHLLNASTWRLSDHFGVNNVAAVVALFNAAPALIAAATRLAEIEGALLFLKGGRSPQVYIDRARELGWTPKGSE